MQVIDQNEFVIVRMKNKEQANIACSGEGKNMMNRLKTIRCPKCGTVLQTKEEILEDKHYRDKPELNLFKVIRDTASLTNKISLKIESRPHFQ